MSKVKTWFKEHEGMFYVGGACIIAGAMYGACKGYTLGRTVGNLEGYNATMNWIQNTFPEAKKLIEDWIANNPESIISEEEAIQLLMKR